MSIWITHPVILESKSVQLLPLDESHFSALESLSKDERIWEHYPFDGTEISRFRGVLNQAMLEMEKGTQYPFVIFHKEDQKIIGSTRYLDLQRNHKKLEIGSTWLHHDYWATSVNLECKLLLLTHCFEELMTVRVQLRTDENNIRSRKAIEKIGGKFEGVFRNDMIRDNNTKRNSSYYSLIDEEWPENKIRLESMIKKCLVEK